MCFIILSLIILSIIFITGEVRLIGLYLLAKVQSPFLKIGVTIASFQELGRAEELNDLLNKIESGTLNCWLHSLKDNIGQQSGPDALAGLSADNLAWTSYGLNSIIC